MGIEIPPDYGQATFGWQLSGSPKIINTTIGFVDNPARSISQIAQDVDVAWLTNPGNAANLTIGYNILPTKVVVNRGGGILSAENGVVVPTTANAPAMPPQVALLVTKRTALGGRRFKGRMYLPACFMQEALVSAAGTLDAAAQAVIQGRLNLFVAAMAAAGLPLRLLHSPATPFVVPTELTALQLQAQVATQRDRNR